MKTLEGREAQQNRSIVDIARLRTSRLGSDVM
jgi:hypothetical protein